MIDTQKIAESLPEAQEFNTLAPPVHGCLPTGGTVFESRAGIAPPPFSKEDISDRNTDWYSREVSRIQSLPPKEASKAIEEFSKPDGVRFTLGGLDTKITFTGANPYGDRRGKKRKISQFTKKSRKEYRDFVRACPLLYEDARRWLFVVLTYDGQSFPDSGKVAKAHLQSFLKRLVRDGYQYYLWTQEFQSRGAIHFNLIIENRMPQGKREKHQKQILTAHQKWLASMWHEITGSDQYAHLLYGCKVTPIQGEDMVTTLSYIAKYAGKVDQSTPKEWYQDIGRYWGHSRTLKSARVHYQLVAGAPPAGGRGTSAPPGGEPATLSRVIRTLSKFHRSSRIDQAKKQGLRENGITPEILSIARANGIPDTDSFICEIERRTGVMYWKRPKKVRNGLTLYGEKPGDDVVSLQRLRSIVNRLGWDVVPVSTDKAERRLSSLASSAPNGSLTRIIENAVQAGIEIPPPNSKPLRAFSPSYLSPKWEQTTLELTVDRPPGSA